MVVQPCHGIDLATPAPKRSENLKKRANDSKTKEINLDFNSDTCTHFFDASEMQARSFKKCLASAPLEVISLGTPFDTSKSASF
jgi:hypothetical protein